MSSSNPVTTCILTKERHTLIYTLVGITGVPLTRFNIHNSNY